MKSFAKIVRISLLAGGAAALFAVAPVTAASAQDGTTVVAVEQGNWTLKEREDWLHNRLNQARHEGSIDRTEYERVKQELGGIHEDEETMRDHHDGQLTDNQTADLEARLDDVASKIHWLRENSFQRPW
jgi:hypothetical protein